MAILFVKQMVGWFMFINSAMVIFLLPLSFFRFFWWRFNVWGELAAIVLGLPLSILVWFVLDFQNTAEHPMWQGLGLLFGLSFLVLIGGDPADAGRIPRNADAFYERCRPPGFWGRVRDRAAGGAVGSPSTCRLLVDSGLGILACLGLVLATNAVFVGNWPVVAVGSVMAAGGGGWLIRRVINQTYGREAESLHRRKQNLTDRTKEP